MRYLIQIESATKFFLIKDQIHEAHSVEIDRHEAHDLIFDPDKAETMFNDGRKITEIDP